VIPGGRPNRIAEDLAALDEVTPEEFCRRLRDADLIDPAAPIPAAW
jgi:D-threo-aldose 1-dehydrogenase